MKKLCLALLCLALLALSACAGSQVTTVEGTIDRDISIAKVEQAITTAANGLKWATRKLDGNTIEATLVARGHQVVVDISYSKKGYAIKYKDSTNMKYNAEKHTIHAKYGKWVRNLDLRIRRELVYM